MPGACRRDLLGVALLLALLPAARDAAACDSVMCSLVTRGQDGRLGRGHFRLDLSYRFAPMDRGRQGSGATDDVRSPQLFLERGLFVDAFHRDLDGREQALQLDLTYGLASDTTLIISLPVWGGREMQFLYLGTQERYDVTGFGDLLVGARRSLLGGRLVAGFSVELPTGPDDEGPDIHGGAFGPALQPGSGSWDLVGSVSASHRALGLGWDLALSYQRNGSNRFRFSFGDGFIAGLSASRTLAGPLSGSLQAKLVHLRRDEFHGIDVPSSGSSTLYLSPGLRFTLGRATVLQAVLQLPAWQYVNEVQLAASSVVTLAVSRSF